VAIYKTQSSNLLLRAAEPVHEVKTSVAFPKMCRFISDFYIRIPKNAHNLFIHNDLCGIYIENTCKRIIFSSLNSENRASYSKTRHNISNLSALKCTCFFVVKPSNPAENCGLPPPHFSAFQKSLCVPVSPAGGHKLTSPRPRRNRHTLSRLTAHVHRSRAVSASFASPRPGLLWSGRKST
jgi:hypothetical protein